MNLPEQLKGANYVSPFSIPHCFVQRQAVGNKIKQFILTIYQLLALPNDLHVHFQYDRYALLHGAK